MMQEICADSALEERGFELSVPVQGKLCCRALPLGFACEGKSAEAGAAVQLAVSIATSHSTNIARVGLHRSDVENHDPLMGDRGFESTSLQQRVWCEPDFRGRSLPVTLKRGEEIGSGRGLGWMPRTAAALERVQQHCPEPRQKAVIAANNLPQKLGGGCLSHQL
jgi:hypothetical protein